MSNQLLNMVLNKKQTLAAMGLMLFLCSSAMRVAAATNRYMVFFTDKEGTTYSIDAPEDFLSERAIARRTNQGLDITEDDFPVNPAYLAGVKAIDGVEVLYSTRWMNGVLIEADETLIDDVSALSYVSSVTLVAPGERPAASGRKSRISRRATARTAAASDAQLAQLGMDQMHEDGYRGEGIYIAVLDVGFPNVDAIAAMAHIFSEGRFNDSVSYDFVHGTTDVFANDEHGTEVLSTIAAYDEDALVGGAYKASFQLYVTEDDDSEHHIEEYNWLFAAERADSAGIDIISSSLGYNTFDSPSVDYEKTELDGQTAVITKAAQWAADRGVVVVVSAGNEGNNAWKLITTPADATDVLAVGAVNAQGLRASLSSVGPTADGRIKPDVMARGVSTAVLSSSGNVAAVNGTSLAAPLVASLAAGIWQRYPNLTALELIELIRTTASQADAPDSLMGYGIASYTGVVVGITDEQAEAQTVTIFPNPLTDTLNIRLENVDNIDAITTCHAAIVSMQGKLIVDEDLAVSWEEGVFSTDISSLARGMYILRLWLNDQLYAFKVVKQ